MNAVTEYFENTTILGFVLGLILASLVVRIIYEILTGK